MISLIADQHVARRDTPFFTDRRRGLRAGTTWRIKQDPVYIYRTHSRSFPLFAGLKSLFSRLSPPLTLPKRVKPVKIIRTTPEARKSAPTGSPILASVAARSSAVLQGLKGFPLSAFLVAGGAFLVSFIVVDWESPSLSMFLQRAKSPEPLVDSQFEQSLASYVGVGPLSPAEGDMPLDLMETFSWGSYTVKRGDTISGIAAGQHISLDAIIASNGISNVKRLREGETLRIPNMDGIPYTVKKGDNVSKISAAMGVPPEAILDANDIQDDTIAQGTVLFIPGARMKREELKMAMGDLFIYPIRGRLTSPFGWRDDPISGVRRHHAAVDLAAGTGTPIKAAMDGRVSVVGSNPTYGKYVILEHGSGYQTMYAHMSVVSVKQGVYVTQGFKIGEVGSTGYSTGPHLHFAVYKNGRAVNPLEFLNQ